MSKQSPPLELFQKSEPSFQNEEQWVNGINNGDKTAFREMFNAYYAPLGRFAYRLVQSEVIAEELVQNLFLWIWENRLTWRVEGTLNAYLFKAIKNKSYSYWRDESRKSRYLERMDDNEDSYSFHVQPIEESNDRFVRAAEKAIEDLPEKGRMIYKLSRLEGLTYNEIAEVLDISPKTVETHMRRSLETLRNKLSKYIPLLYLFSQIRGPFF